MQSFWYTPHLRLRDTSALGSARVVAIRIDIPGIEGPAQCVTNHALGAESWDVFLPPGDMNGSWIGRQDGQRIPDATVDVAAHVSAVLSDGLGVSLTLTGKLVSVEARSWTDSGKDAPYCV